MMLGGSSLGQTYLAGLPFGTTSNNVPQSAVETITIDLVAVSSISLGGGPAGVPQAEGIWISDWDVATTGLSFGETPTWTEISAIASGPGMGVATNPPRVDSEFIVIYDILVPPVASGPGMSVVVPPPPPPIIPVDIPFDEDWKVDGFALQTFAYNIATWGGSRQTPPKLKGANASIPHRPGQKWYQKTVDARVLSLGMWVIGANTNGSAGNRQTFERNWRALRRMLWTPDREVVLSKTFYDDVTNGLITAQAKAQYVDGLSPSMTGRRRASFVVDMMLADPWFYEITNKTFTISMGATLLIPTFGDYPTIRMSIRFVGPCAYPTLTTSSGVSVKYNGSVNSGQSILIDVENFTASKVTGSSSIDVTSSISHSGHPNWMRLGGSTSVNVLMSGSSDTGTATIIATPIWL